MVISLDHSFCSGTSVLHLVHRAFCDLRRHHTSTFDGQSIFRGGNGIPVLIHNVKHTVSNIALPDRAADASSYRVSHTRTLVADTGSDRDADRDANAGSDRDADASSYRVSHARALAADAGSDRDALDHVSHTRTLVADTGSDRDALDASSS
jgi:hypothetical protein